MELWILLPLISALLMGQATDIEIQTKEILRLKKMLNTELATRTGQKLAKIEKDTDRDFFMDPEEAVKYGLIDEVIRAPIQK